MKHTPLTETVCNRIQNGDIYALRDLIQTGTDANAADADGRPLLHYAALSGVADMVRLLLGSGATVQNSPNAGTYLTEAVFGGDPETVGVLIAAGCDPSTQGTYGGPPLFVASYRDTGDTLGIARMLLAAGASPDQQIHYGTTALHHAASGANGELVRLFLRHNANPNIADSAGMNALHHALSYPRERNPEAFLDVVTQLLDAEADINAATKPDEFQQGATALHLAAENAPVRIVQLLLDRGANPDTPNAKGRTPLMQALSNEPRFAAILAAGADISTLVAAKGKPAY